MNKICPKCKKEKHINLYHRNKTKKDGLCYSCKECVSQYDKRYRQRNLEKATAQKKAYYQAHKEKSSLYGKKSNLKRKYNMTLEQYDQMFETQGGVCAICGLPELMKRLAVDHNHKTGEIRGLLCYSCNTKLGWFEKYGSNAIKYLDKKDKSCLPA